MSKDKFEVVMFLCTVVGTLIAALAYVNDVAFSNETPSLAASVLVEESRNITVVPKNVFPKAEYIPVSDTSPLCKENGNVCNVKSGGNSVINGYTTVIGVRSGGDTFISSSNKRMP